MASSNQWFFTESATGTNPDRQSYEYKNNLYFKNLNSGNKLYGFDNGGYTIKDFDDIGVIDLNSVHNADASFTIEFTVKEKVIDLSKAVNYITFGYQIRGHEGVTITVGRDVGSPYVVLGTITKDGVDKATTMNEVKFVTEPNVEYEYTLYYNHFGTEEEKLKLFREYECIATAATMNTKTFSIIDRQLFIGSSAWVNEPSWDGTFDYAKDLTFMGEFNFYTNKAIDKGFLPGSIIYPVHWSLSNISNTNRNNLHIATRNDTLEFRFHCLKEAPENTVVAFLDGRSNNITLQNVNHNHPRLDEDGNDILTSLYTFRLTVENDWPLDGFFSYGLNVDGAITLSNIIPPTNNFYIDNSDANVNFTLGTPTSSTIDVTLHASNAIVDNYLTALSLSNYENYSLTFYASNTDHTLNTTVNNSSITNGGTYTINGLNSESYYNVYATVRDPFGNKSGRILPLVDESSTNIIETDDITRPFFELAPSPNRIYSVKLDTTNKPGIKLHYFAWDTAAELNHKYRTYICLSKSDDNQLAPYTRYDNKNITGPDWEIVSAYTISKNNYSEEYAINFLLTHNDVVAMISAWGNYYFRAVRSTSSITYSDVLAYLDSSSSTAADHVTWLKPFGNAVVNGVDYEYVVTNNHYQHYAERTNFVKAEAPYEVEFSQAYNNAGVLENILQETSYTFTIFLEDDAGNVYTESHTHNIVNNISFVSIVSDFAPDTNVAKPGNNLTLSFTTDYNISSSFLNVNMLGSTITPVSTDGMNWTATKQVTAIHTSGPATYSVAQNPDMLPVSAFDQTSHTLYLQTVDASIKPGITFTSNLTDLRVNNIVDFIDDYTINSNNNLISLEFNINSTTYTYDYVNKGGIETVYTFPGLRENTAYDISVSLSNVFTKSEPIILGNIRTLLDVPSIAIDVTTTDITSSAYPLVQLSSSSVVTEHTTPFNVHVYLADFNITDAAAVKTFLLSTTAQATSVPTGANIGIGTLMSADIVTYLSGSAASHTTKTIIPSLTKTFYLYGLINDTASEPVYAKKTVTLDYTISTPVLTNTSYDYFVRNGDVVEMTWTTKYVSQASDFTDLKIFGATASTPTSVDGLNWRSTATVSAGTATHTVKYLGSSLTVNAAGVFYDNAAPTFTIELDTSSTGYFVFSLANFGADTYTNQIVPQGVSTNYTVYFTLTESESGSVSNYTFVKDYANLTNNTYLLGGLEEAKYYVISAKLTDPANNEITVVYDNGTPTQTSDITIPIVNDLTATVTFKDANKVPGLAISANTVDNSTYDVYLSVLNYQLTGTDAQKRDAIMSVFLSKDTVTTRNANVVTNKDMYTFFKTGDNTTQHDILTEEQYYVYCMAIDISDNFIITNTVITIDNTFVEKSVVTDYGADQTIAQTNHTITLSFKMNYRVLSSQLNVIMLGTSAVPTTSDGGLTWSVQKVVDANIPSGKATFSVSQTPDIGVSLAVFNDASLTDVYIQKEPTTLVNLPATNLHEIAVSVVSGKYVFTPAVTSFVKGHTYVFDNTSVAGAHPLRFSTSDTHPGFDLETIVFKDDDNHIIVVTIPETYATPLFAHCALHSGMGSGVNGGSSGIPISGTGDNIAFVGTTNQLKIVKLKENIRDFTINSNNNAFKMTLNVGNSQLSEVFENITSMPDSFTFASLKENQSFAVSASLSNMFGENTISLGSARTAFDFPIISAAASVSSVNYDPAVRVSSVQITEPTSLFDVYFEVTDFKLNTNSAIHDFLTNTPGLTPKVTDVEPGYDVSPFLVDTLVQSYWSSNAVSGVKSNVIVPSPNSSYHFYAYVNDKSTSVVPSTITSANINYNNFGSVTDASLSNLSNPYVVRNGDTVRMSWSTQYNVSSSAFTNVTLYGVDVTSAITTTDNRNWYADLVVSRESNLNSLGQNMVFLEKHITSFDTTNAVLYHQPHTFTIVIVNRSVDGFQAQLSNISLPTPLNPPDSVTIDPYVVTFSVLNLSTNTTAVFERSFTDFSVMRDSIFTLNGFTEFTPCKITCTLRDPGNNLATVSYNAGNTVYTLETNAPVLVNDGSLVANTVEGELFVQVDNVRAYDTQSKFQVYVGLSTLNDMTAFTIDAMSSLVGSGAVEVSPSLLPSAIPVTHNTSNLTKCIDTDGVNLFANNLEYEREYFVVANVRDDFGNVAHPNAVVIGSATMYRIVLENVDETVVEITPEDDANVGQETITDSAVNIGFQEVVETTVSYSGVNQSGASIEIVATENPITENNALDMSLVEGGLTVPVSSTASTSDAFTFSMSVVNTDTTSLQSSVTLFEDVVNNISVTMNTVTSYSGQNDSGESVISLSTTQNPLVADPPIYVIEAPEAGGSPVRIEAVQNPFVVDPVDNSVSLDLGLTTSGITLPPTQVPTTETFTYSIDVNSASDTFNPETTLVEDPSKSIKVSMTDTVLTIRTSDNYMVSYPISATLTPTEANNITIAQTVDATTGEVVITAYNNGVALTSPTVTGTGSPSVINSPDVSLSIPAQPNIVVDSIVMYDTPQTTNTEPSPNTISFSTIETVSVDLSLLEENIVIPTSSTSGSEDFSFSVSLRTQNTTDPAAQYTLIQSPDSSVTMQVASVDSYFVQNVANEERIEIVAPQNPMVTTSTGAQALSLALTTNGITIPPSTVPTNTQDFTYSVTVNSTDNTFGTDTVLLQDTTNNVVVTMTDTILTVRTNENHIMTFPITTTINQNNQPNNITITQSVTDTGNVIISAFNNNKELSASSVTGTATTINNDNASFTVPTQTHTVLNNIVMYDTIQTSNAVASPNTLAFTVENESVITLSTNEGHTSTFTTSLNITEITNVTVAQHTDSATGEVQLSMFANGSSVTQSSTTGTATPINNTNLEIPIQEDLVINEIAFYETLESSNDTPTPNGVAFSSVVTNTITVSTNEGHTATYNVSSIDSTQLNNITLNQSVDPNTGVVTTHVYTNGQQATLTSESGNTSAINNNDLVIPSQPNLVVESIVYYDTLETSNQAPSSNTITFTQEVETTTTYVGVDSSGNGNNIILVATENPLTPDSVTGDYSVNMGVVTEDVVIPTTSSVRQSDNLTYSINIKKTDGTFGAKTTLFQQESTGVEFYITDTEIVLQTSATDTITFPIEMTSDTWNNISVSQETLIDGSVVMKVFANGEQLFSSGSTGTLSQIDASIPLTIPAQQTDLLVDGIILYDKPISSGMVQSLANTSTFKIKLDFEDAYITDYNVSFSNNKFYFNEDYERQGLVLNSNVQYTFSQDGTGQPLLFSTAGQFPIPSTDTLNVNYYLNNSLIGNNPTRYAQEYFTSINNKVVVRPKASSNTLYYHTTSTTLGGTARVTVKDEEARIRNKASTSASAQPLYIMTPKFTTDTFSGKYAMNFSSQNQDVFSFTNFDFDANESTISMWIKPGASNIPVLSQEGIFELKLDTNNKLVLDILANDFPVQHMSNVGTAALDAQKISISNIQFKTPLTNPTYVYAMAAFESYDKKTALELMDEFRDTDSVFFSSNSASNLSISLNSVLNANKTSFTSTELADKAFVYLHTRNDSNDFAYGMSNQFHKVAVSHQPGVPRVIVNSMDFELDNLTVTGKVRFSSGELTTIKIALFEDSVDLSDDEVVKTFVNTHGTSVHGLTLPLTLKNTVYGFTHVLNTAFTSSAESTTTSLSNANIYHMRVSVVKSSVENILVKKSYYPVRAYTEELATRDYVNIPSNTVDRKISGAFTDPIFASDNYVYFPLTNVVKFIPFDYNNLQNSAQFTDANVKYFKHGTNTINSFVSSHDDYVMFHIVETNEFYIVNMVDINNYCVANGVTNADLSILSSTELPTLFKTTLNLRNTSIWDAAGMMRSNRVALSSNFAVIVDDVANDTKLYIYFRTSESEWDLVQTLNYTEEHIHVSGCVQITTTHLAFSVRVSNTTPSKIAIFKANGITFEYSQEIIFAQAGYDNAFAMNDKFLLVAKTVGGSILDCYLLENGIWVYKNGANVTLAYQNYQNQATTSYNNLSLYGNRAVIGSIYNSSGDKAKGGVLTYSLDTTVGITYTYELFGFAGYLPNHLGSNGYKYYGSVVDLHKHVMFIQGDTYYTYAYW